MLVASHDAALAADALGHVEMKPILLAGFERTRGNQRSRPGFGFVWDLAASRRDDTHQLASEQRKVDCPGGTNVQSTLCPSAPRRLLVSARSVPRLDEAAAYTVLTKGATPATEP